MINPFQQQFGGRRNSSAGRSSNPFMRNFVNSSRGQQQSNYGIAQTPPSQPAFNNQPAMANNPAAKAKPPGYIDMSKQTSFETQNTRNTQRVDNPRSNPFVGVDSNLPVNTVRPDSSRGTTNSPVTPPPPAFGPQQPVSSGGGGPGYWPTQGEQTLLQMGINPFGSSPTAQQQQYLSSVNPHLGGYRMTGNYAGPTDTGRDYTAVQLAYDAGIDPGAAFRNQWLGGASQAQLAYQNAINPMTYNGVSYRDYYDNALNAMSNNNRRMNPDRYNATYQPGGGNSQQAEFGPYYP